MFWDMTQTRRASILQARLVKIVVWFDESEETAWCVESSTRPLNA